MEHNPYQSPAADLYGTSSGLVGEAVTEGVLRALRGTKGWVKFLSILLFIGAVLMCLLGLFMFGMTLIGGGLASASEEVGSAMAAFGGIIGAGVVGVIYVTFGVLYIYPGMKLWAYASGIERLLKDRSSLSLEKALDEQRRFWKFAGIIALVMIVLYVVVIVGVLMIGVVAATRG